MSNLKSHMLRVSAIIEKKTVSFLASSNIFFHSDFVKYAESNLLSGVNETNYGESIETELHFFSFKWNLTKKEHLAKNTSSLYNILHLTV